MMPRETRSRAGPSRQLESQRKTQRTQPTKSQRGPREFFEESESEEEIQASAQTNHRQKRNRLENVEIPATAIKWTEKGFYDLPAIPSFGDETDDEDEENDANAAAMFVITLLLQHHKKEPFTNNQLRNQITKSGQRFDFDITFKNARKLLLQDFGFVLAEICLSKPFFPIGEASNLDFVEPETVNTQTEISGDEETEGTQRTRGRKTRNPTKTFILVNNFSTNLSFLNCGKRQFAYQRSGDSESAAKLTILALTLLYLFMEGGEASEELLWLFLKPYGFNIDINHRLVGNVRNLINSTFVKQQYILKHHTQSRLDGPELCYYRWGPRADLEFSRLSLLKMCAKVFGVEADMEHFGERYTNAEATEKRRKAKLEAFSRNI